MHSTLVEWAIREDVLLQTGDVVFIEARDQDVFYTNPMAFLPGLTDDRYLAPLRRMEKRVIATGAEDRHVEESRRIGALLREKGVQVQLDIWPGWSHDWPYWMEMMRRYV